MRVPSAVWKGLGVAGLVGVAATGVVVARDQRRRTAMSPDQVRKQLHRRLADLDRDGEDATATTSETGDAERLIDLPVVPVKARTRGRRRRR